MFRIKICGVTTVEDARIAADAGADAIGLNFFDKSPRFVSERVAERIAAALPVGVKKIGVFVNATASEIRDRYVAASLDLIQLHGDEPPEFLSELDGLPVMRAFRPTGALTSVRDYLSECDRVSLRPAMILIDAFSKDQYGGTGETADWAAIKAARPFLGKAPLVLAGGLNPSNVACAIAAVEPDAVDTASGVEISPGRKSAKLIQAFVAEAQGAFDLVNKSR